MSIPKTIPIMSVFQKLKVDLCMQIHIYRKDSQKQVTITTKQYFEI